MLACLSVDTPSLATSLYIAEEMLFGLLLIIIPLGLITVVVLAALFVQEGARRIAYWARAANSPFFKRDLKRCGTPGAITHADLHR
jgi:hypothetical protein